MSMPPHTHGPGVTDRLVATNTPTLHPRPRDAWLFTLGLAIIWFVFRGPPVDHLGGFDMRFGLAGPNAGDPWKWTAAGMLVLLVLLGEQNGLRSMLLHRPSARDLEWSLWAFGAVMAWSWIAGHLAPQDDNSGIQTISSLGVVGVVALIFTAAITEEVVYRGYLQERLGAFFRSRWLGAASSLAAFAIPHILFFGSSWFVHQLPGTLAIIAITLVRRNLYAAMVLHILINAPILIPTVLGNH